MRWVKVLGAYGHEPEAAVLLTAADVRRDGFGDNPRFEVLLAGQAAPAEALAAGLLYTLFTYFFLALAGLPLTRRGLDL